VEIVRRYRGRFGSGLFLLSVLVLFAAGCATPPAPTPLVFDEPLPDDPGPDIGGLALQDEVFADGQITFDEYQRAMHQYARCVRDEGFEVQGPLQYPEGGIAIAVGADPTLQLGIRMRAGDDPNDRLGEVAARCQAQWSYAIEQLYLRQFTPTEAEIQAWLERAWKCAAEKGTRLSSPPTEQEAIFSVIDGCRPWEPEG
jgi:hypothetical protein